MARVRGREVVGALALVLALTSCSGDDGGDVLVREVSRSTVTEVVEAPATVTAKAEATVTAAADGRVQRLRVREGQQVRAGAVLLKLASPRAREALREAREADAEAAAGGSVGVSGGGLSAEAEQAAAQARRSFARARAAAERIPAPLVRRQALAALRASEAQYEAAQAQAAAAVAQFEAGFGSLASALSSLSSAQRVQTRAAVAAAERTVAALTVRAPIGGTVSLVPPESGSASGPALDGLPESLQGQAESLLGGGGSATVTGSLSKGQPVSGGEPLLTVTDSSVLTLAAQVDETDVLLVERGVEGAVELDAVPDAVYDATVATVDPAPTTSSRGGVTYVVRLALGPGERADGTRAPEPRPGMSAVVGLRVRTSTDAVAVPAAAVLRDGRRDTVWVVKNDVVRSRTVRLGAQGRARVEVVEGLAPGERVVVRGADRVTDGQRLP
jgi:multidrug efflux pump subunit AcrA (membrane-fusion protein)